MEQIFIQVILVTALAIPAVILLLPTRGARSLAIRRLTLIAVLLAGIVAVIFPQLADGAARMLGVGRGADLLLYGLGIVFLGYALSASAHARRLDRQVAQLARAMAIAQADDPQRPRERA